MPDRAGAELGDVRDDQRAIAALRHGWERFLRPMASLAAPLPILVDIAMRCAREERGSIRDNERRRVVHHEFHDAVRDAAQGLFGQRLLSLEDRRARDRPVYGLGCRAPWQALAAEHLGRAGLAVRRLRPNDGLAVAARDHEEALADRRRAIVAGAQLAELQLVAQLAKLAAPLAERLARAILDREALIAERPPGLELLNVLQQDQVWLHPLRPQDYNPCEIADRLLARLAALGLAEMFAVRREPSERYPRQTRERIDLDVARRIRSTQLGDKISHDLYRIDLPDVVADMQGAGVVGLMHADRLLVMVDGDIHGAAQRGFDAGGCPAAAGEVVDDNAGHARSLLKMVGASPRGPQARPIPARLRVG